MTTQILTTKLYIPLLRPNHVSRPHLIQRLEAGLGEKLTLISAPAGYGKTSLVAEWISESRTHFCWLSLDESDNDIGRFLAYFIASLDSINIAVDQQLLDLIQSTQPIQIENILIPLINQITDSQKDFALVLDDYHLIQNKEIHDALTYILEYSPPSMHLVIITRADPHLPLSRLRARGQLTEFRVSDLRFSVDEGEILLNQVHDLHLPSESIATLVNRSDGWIAALQMFSLAVKERSDPTEYIHDFSGSQTYIADYLTEEVLQQQSEDIQDFLMKTSVLDRLSGSLCDAVVGGENSHLILQYLRDSNLFLTSLDDENHWFRYHRLFANLLQGRLLESHSEILPGFYLNASRWFEENRYLSEAIDYAIRGEHFKRAAALIEQNAEETIMQSEISTFIRWIEKLPEDLVYQKTSLCVLYAWAVLVYDGQTQVARSYLHKVKPVDTHITGQLNTVRSILAVFDGQISTAVELARQALKQLSPDDHFFRNITGWNLSGSLAVSGDTEGGLEVLREVVQTSLASHHYMVAIIALCRLGAAQTQKGELHKARDTLEQAIDIATTDQRQPLSAASEAFMWLGKIYYEWNQLDTAREVLQESINLSKRWRETSAIESYVTMANILQSQGDVEGANRMMGEARILASQTTATKNDDKFVASQQVYLQLEQGDLQSAQRWSTERGLEKFISAKNLDLSEKIGAAVILHYELIAFARVLIVNEQYEQALHLLDLVLPFIERLSFLQKIIEIHVLTAIGLQAQSRVDAALYSLNTALKLAQPEGFIRVFLNDGNLIASLLREIEVRGEISQFARELLQTLTPAVEKPKLHADLVDPLSERELEVLRMLRTELNAPEIAEHLHISVTTMRTHTRNIYSKLGVHSRFEAVTRVEELGLL